jgi:hypothetical protein
MPDLGIQSQSLTYFENRLALLESLPKGMVMAELGVFEGMFSDEIFRRCAPKELHLVDLWRKSRSPDATHLKVKKLKWLGMWRAKRRIQRRYRQEPRVRVHQGDTAAVLGAFPDNYFDFVYVDADHSYAGVRRDLEVAFQKVKNGGYICGHDFTEVLDGVDTRRNPGVRRAVEEFCEAHGLEINFLTMPSPTITDRCLTYGIRIRK